MRSGKPSALERLSFPADKISKSGKARYLTSDGFEGFVEQVALHLLKSEGWDGIWSGNELWWTLMPLLFWDILYARLDGVWTPEFGDFPSQRQDMPRDLFHPEFYVRRESMILNRIEVLRSKDLVTEIEQAYIAYRGRPCRAVENWNRFSPEELNKAAEVLPSEALLGVMHRLLANFNSNRRGLPDLFLWNDEGPAFAEVKSSGDKLSEFQETWLNFLESLRLRTLLIRISAA